MKRYFALGLAGVLIQGAVIAAELTPREVMINGVEFVRIDGGDLHFPIPRLDPTTGYRIGNGQREVTVRVDTYYLGKYEARARDFIRFMEQGRVSHADHYDTQLPGVAGVGARDGCAVRKNAQGYFLVEPERDLPVTHLSWDLADEFAQWMGFRLPIEVEWLRAFRGGDRRTYPWGGDYPDDTYAAFQEGATACNVRPVGSFEKGRSPFGVYDMAGNVYEYVADWYSPIFYNSLQGGERNPVSTKPFRMPVMDAPLRMVRGGRWASGPTELSASGSRDFNESGKPFICFGVRFAIDAARVAQAIAAGSARVLVP